MTNTDTNNTAPKKSKLKALLDRKELIVADGAMATSLYEKGYYINRSFEELCLTEPNAVTEVTKDFIRAGSQIIHTNTFNATQPKLVKYGLQNHLSEIISRATQIALDAAQNEILVMGLLGPLGLLIEPLGPTSLDEAEEFYAEILRTFVKFEIDGFAINAIHDLNEVKCAIRAIRNISNLPITVSVGLNESLRTSYGYNLKNLAQLGTEYNLDAIGICGEIGPSPMLTAIEELRNLTDKPIIALPNAGLPRYVNDQYIYLCNPDYIGKFAKRFAQAGAQIIGGHSGVYETHIKAISNNLKSASRNVFSKNTDVNLDIKKNITDRFGKNADGSEQHPTVFKPITESGRPVKDLSKRSLLGQFLAEKKPIVSVELIPPPINEINRFIEKCTLLENAKIPFVNIPDSARAMTRISSVHLTHFIKNKFNIEPIPHLTCRDRNLIGLQSELLGAHVSDIRNLLLVTGDPPKLGNNPGASAVFDVDAIGLTHIVSRLNRGLDMGGTSTSQQTEFVIGVALNPTAKNIDLEINRFNFKIEAGCDFAITQPIYNIDAYMHFIDKIKLNCPPVIMGIWPLISLRNAEFLKYEVPGVDIPNWVIDEMQKAGDSKSEALKRGIDIALKTIEKAKGLVAGFQINAPFNKVQVAIEVIKKSEIQG